MDFKDRINHFPEEMKKSMSWFKPCNLIQWFLPPILQQLGSCWAAEVAVVVLRVFKGQGRVRKSDQVLLLLSCSCGMARMVPAAMQRVCVYESVCERVRVCACMCICVCVYYCSLPGRITCFTTVPCKAWPWFSQVKMLVCWPKPNQNKK